MEQFPDCGDRMSFQTIKRIPDSPNDVTAKWFSEILGQPIEESTFQASTSSLTGVGFLSILIRVQYQTNDGTVHQVIVKLLPDHPDAKALVINDKFDQTEILAYKKLIPDLIQEVPDLGKYFCDMVFGDIRNQDNSNANDIPSPYSSVLVLKDLKPEGYVMVHLSDSMTQVQFDQGLYFFSKLHAASMSLEQRRKTSIVAAFQPWFPKFSIPAPPGSPDPTLFEFFPMGFASMYELLDGDQKVKKETYAAMKEIEGRTAEIFRAVIKAGSKFPCLVHGDLWSHNVLVHNDEIKIVDWQMVGYTDPIYDLAIYIIFCIPFEDITAQGIMTAAKTYYELSSALIKTLGLPKLRSWDEFEQFFKTYGLGHAFIWYVNSAPALVSCPNSKEKLLKIFHLLEELNVIDFVSSVQ